MADAAMVARARPPHGYEPIVSNSAFGWHVGPLFERPHQGGAVERGFRVDDCHINAGGICHGGMMMTFADILLSAAVMRVIAPPFVTVRLTTDFIGPARHDQWVSGRAHARPMRDKDGESDLVAVDGTVMAEDAVAARINAVFKALRRR